MQERDLKVLLLCDYRKDGAQTVLDHIDAIRDYSGVSVYVVSMLGKLPQGLDVNRFDAIIIHYSLIISVDTYLAPEAREAIRNFQGLKAVFIQDEYRWIDRTIDVLISMEIDLLFTCVPEREVENVYSTLRLPKLKKITVLTGYIPSELLDVAPLNYASRPIDVGYRTRKLSAFYGKLAREKWQIADKFASDARAYGLVCDLSYKEEKRLYGKDWIDFIRSCRGMLGAESGANVFDFTGEILPAVENYEREHPDATFEDIEAAFFPGLDGTIKLNQISPRCFEAAALQTQMILYEGEYSGILVPGRHYVPLRKDHSNMAEVVEAIRDQNTWEEMIACAYEEIARGDAWSYRAFGRRVGQEVTNGVVAKGNDPYPCRGYERAEFNQIILRHARELAALHAARRQQAGLLSRWATVFATRGPRYLVAPARKCWHSYKRIRQSIIHKIPAVSPSMLLEKVQVFSGEDDARLRSQDFAALTGVESRPESLIVTNFGENPSSQTDTDEANTDYWNELCGSPLARKLGIVDESAASLQRFDEWYFDFYPYLEKWVPLGAMAGKDVLEVGLGYGSLSQKLAAAQARYKGLDIAAGPVGMVNHRLALHGLEGKAERGSILAPPYTPASFDYVVAVGSLHHTGNLQRAIDSCHRLLRPGGKLCLMVYYAYSYRQLLKNERAVQAYSDTEAAGWRGVMDDVNAGMRAAYDVDTTGRGAPHTDFVSRASLRWLCRKFIDVEMSLKNIDQQTPFATTPRKSLLNTDWPAKVGLDLYAIATRGQ